MVSFYVVFGGKGEDRFVEWKSELARQRPAARRSSANASC
jgi:hypothetical protein